MVAGINRVGDRARLRSSLHYRYPDDQVGVFYGLAGSLINALADYPKAGKKAVYVDMGYWGRKDGGRFAGFHKLAVNSRHPTAYFQAQPHSKARFESFGVPVESWRPDAPDAPILIAGMGPKGSRFEGFGIAGWEREVIGQLRQHTDRPIWYRPKPNWEGARPLDGAIMVDKDALLAAQLQGCHAVVAHHSNAAVEGLCHGFPAFVAEGVALALGSADLSTIEAPRMVDEGARRQWLADIAWTQWSVAEMAEGRAWRYLKDEGLVP